MAISLLSLIQNASSSPLLCNHHMINFGLKIKIKKNINIKLIIKIKDKNANLPIIFDPKCLLFSSALQSPHDQWRLGAHLSSADERG